MSLAQAMLVLVNVMSVCAVLYHVDPAVKLTIRPLLGQEIILHPLTLVAVEPGPCVPHLGLSIGG